MLENAAPPRLFWLMDLSLPVSDELSEGWMARSSLSAKACECGVFSPAAAAATTSPLSLPPATGDLWEKNRGDPGKAPDGRRGADAQPPSWQSSQTRKPRLFWNSLHAAADKPTVGEDEQPPKHYHMIEVNLEKGGQGDDKSQQLNGR